jgi:hypothetical protein
VIVARDKRERKKEREREREREREKGRWERGRKEGGGGVEWSE